QRLEWDAAGLTVLQLLPQAAGRARLREVHYPRSTGERTGRAAAFLARRIATRRRSAELALAESVQRGLESPGCDGAATAAAPPALADFRQSIARLLPGGDRDPGDAP
ncbi:MAG: hypothetical protein JSR54_08570, partial [Proteobacteria bacterium]|nr:hypothetical protein [Pseudomonadota bacterium]